MTWGGTIGGPRLGTQVSTMTPQLRDFFGAPEDAGLLVQGIEPGSAADAAGMRVGDVLVEVDGESIDRVADVHRALADRGDGDVVAVKLVRKKKRKTLKATLSDGSAIESPGVSSIPPEVRVEVEQQLERAREQLREVERQLEQLERGADDDGPKNKKKTRRLRRKKNKAKSDR